MESLSFTRGGEKHNRDFSTGHALVDAVGQLRRLSGLIIDHRWPFHAAFYSEEENLNLRALILFADLIDWYSPRILFDPDTKRPIAAESKFDGEYLVQTYKKWGRRWGLSEDSTRAAIHAMMAKGLVQQRPFKSIKGNNEKPFEIWPVPDMVREVTSGMPNSGIVRPVTLAQHLKTDHWVIDEIFQIYFEGDVIDYNWIGHAYFCNEKGKINIPAMLVFAHLYFLHLPTEVTDPISHDVIAKKKKFDGDKLYKSYRSWREASPFSDEQLRNAVAFLRRLPAFEKKQGLILAEVSPIVDRKGDLTNNKILIELVFERVQELLYGSSKVMPKNTEAPPENSFFSPTDAKKSGGLMPKNTEASCQKIPRRTYKQVHNHFPNIHQQQAAIAADGGDSDFSKSNGETGQALTSSETPQPTDPSDWPAPRRTELVQRILNFGTGIRSSFVRKFVDAAPAHCEMWAQHWPSLDEADPDFWRDQKGSPAAALYLRLSDPNILPPVLLAQKRAKEKRADREAQLTEERERLEARKAEEHEAATLRFKDAMAVWKRFDVLSIELKRDVERLIQRRAEAVASMVARRGGISRLTPGPGLWVDYMEQVHYALPEVLDKRPQLPHLDQAAMGHFEPEAPAAEPTAEFIDEDDFDESAYEDLDSPLDEAAAQAVIERTIMRYVADIQCDVIGFEDLDERRIETAFTSAQWEQIRAAVKRQLEDDD